MPANMLPIYIVSSLASALISSINGRKQRKLAEQTAAQQIEAQQNNLMMQLEHQKLLHEQGYKQQIANQLRAYELGNSWPLALSPQSIAGQITVLDHVPLFLVLAPMGTSGIQKELDNVWTDMKHFFIQTFNLASETPVILGHYKNAWPVNPSSDYSIIWNWIKDVPTLYIAPYSTNRDGILGFTVAFWGMNSTAPKVQNFVLNIRKLYIDEIRKETKVFEQKCNQGIFEPSNNDALAKNITIFANENAKLANGATFEDLDQTINFYKDVKPTPNVWRSIANQVNPVIKTLSSSIVDMYFILEYGTKPLFPRIVQNISQNDQIPDLLTQGMLDDSPKFELLSGEKFLKDTYIDYSRFAAQHMEPLTGVKYIETFKNALPSTDNVFEKTLAERCIPSGLAPENYSDDQRLFLRKISTIDGVKESEYFSKLIANVSALPEFGTKEIDDEYSLAKKYIAEKRYEEAIPLLEKALKRKQQDAGIYLFDILKSTNYERAIMYLNVEVDRNNTKAIYLMGKEYEKIGDKKEAEKYYQLAANMNNHNAKNNLKERNETMGRNNNGESFFNKSLNQITDDLFTKVLGVLVRAEKPENVDRLTFDGLIARARLLAEGYKGAVNCQCIIGKDVKTGVIQIGIWPIDSAGNVLSDEKGIGQKIMKTMALDDKLNSFLNNGTVANLILTLEK